LPLLVADAMTTTTQIQETLDSIYEKYQHVDEGTVATYIPELGKADPNDFSICIVTVDGQVFSAGDWRKNSVRGTHWGLQAFEFMQWLL
jgi:glutaminase